MEILRGRSCRCVIRGGPFATNKRTGIGCIHFLNNPSAALDEEAGQLPFITSALHRTEAKRFRYEADLARPKKWEPSTEIPLGVVGLQTTSGAGQIRSSS